MFKFEAAIVKSEKLFEDAEISTYNSVKFGAKGYWSDVITAHVRVERDADNTYTVIKEISHSSGGRDTDVEANSVQAEINFAKAILEVAAYMQQLDDKVIMAKYEETKRAIKEAYERKQAEAAIKAELDTAIGTEYATDIVQAAIANSKINTQIIETYTRGTESKVVFVVNSSRSMYMNNGYVGRVTKQELVDKLANMSSRVTVYCKE